MSLLFIGTVALDTLETPYGQAERIAGGSATYASLAASYFAKDINIVAVIGNDFPKADLKSFEEHQINLEGLQIKEDEKSFFWSGRYHADMNSRDTLITDLNVLENFDPVIPASYQNCTYLMLGNLTPGIQKKVIESMHTRPKLIVLDTMNFWMDIMLDDLIEVLSMIDVLTINDEEARQLSGEYSLVKAARKILTMGPKYLVIKKGEHGALLFSADNVFYAPALPLEDVFDPTGAGDTFAGGFIGYLAKSDDLSFDTFKKAIIHGSAMASFCVEKFGTDRLKHLSQQEITDRVARFVSLTTFAV